MFKIAAEMNGELQIFLKNKDGTVKQILDQKIIEEIKFKIKEIENDEKNFIALINEFDNEEEKIAIMEKLFTNIRINDMKN